MPVSAQHYRDRGGNKNLRSPFNEGFSFDSVEQLELVKKLNPALDDPDPQVRRAAWVKWGNTIEGQAFRVR